MKVRFSARARADLQEIFDFIASDSEIFAERTIEKLIQITKNLSKFPESGRIIKHPVDFQLREWIYRNYRIAYRLCEGAVEIITIHHTSRRDEED